MQNLFIERLEKTREQIVTWSNERIDELKAQSETFAERREDLVARGNTKFDQAAGAVRTAEATVLETTRDLLNKANETFDGKAAFLARGAEALDSALIDLRAGHSATLPIDGFDELSIKKILPLMADFDLAQLKTVRAYEAANKARKTLLKELDARIEEFAAA
ncbi:MAG: hypothetical protein GY898_33985 [Proteobacteria bacterium]|nr:hypothetical protein [Pseudomonadota bacterium]